VNELEESQIQGQLLLRNTPVGTQPRAEQRPEPLDGVDMDFAETITVLVAGELPGGMTDRSMTVSPLGQSSIDIIFISIQKSSRSDRGADQRGDRDLLHVLQHPNHHRPGAWNHAQVGGLFLGQGPTPPSTVAVGGASLFFHRLGMTLMSCHHIDFVAFDFAAEGRDRLALDDPFAELGGHLLGVVGVEI